MSTAKDVITSALVGKTVRYEQEPEGENIYNITGAYISGDVLFHKADNIATRETRDFMPRQLEQLTIVQPSTAHKPTPLRESSPERLDSEMPDARETESGHI